MHNAQWSLGRFRVLLAMFCLLCVLWFFKKLNCLISRLIYKLCFAQTPTQVKYQQQPVQCWGESSSPSSVQCRGESFSSSPVQCRGESFSHIPAQCRGESFSHIPVQCRGESSSPSPCTMETRVLVPALYSAEARVFWSELTSLQWTRRRAWLCD